MAEARLANTVTSALRCVKDFQAHCEVSLNRGRGRRPIHRPAYLKSFSARYGRSALQMTAEEMLSDLLWPSSCLFLFPYSLSGKSVGWKFLHTLAASWSTGTSILPFCSKKGDHVLLSPSPQPCRSKLGDPGRKLMRCGIILL